MHSCPVPAAGLLCPAMLLLALLASLHATAVAAVNMSTMPCVPAPCGNLTIAYPFWLAGTHQPYCGYKAFQVACEDQKVYLKNSYWMYQVLDIAYENSSFVVTNVIVQEYCDLTLAGNASSDLGAGPFKISHRNRGLFFLSDCQGQARQLPPPWAPVNCSEYDSPNSFAWLAGSYRPDDILKPLPGNCSVSLMPVLGYLGAVAADYDRLMKGGFLLEYNYTAQDCAPCAQTGSKCSVDAGEDVLECRCPDGVHTAAAACRSQRGHGKIVLIIVLIAATASLLFLCIYVLVWHRKGQTLWFHQARKASSSTERNIEALIVSYGSLAPKRYNYSEVMKITSFLSHKLGEGGYGVVYKGRLLDGRLVAVKFLHDSKGQGEEFVNEVMSIGRTSHINIVSLFGFYLSARNGLLCMNTCPMGLWINTFTVRIPKKF